MQDGLILHWDGIDPACRGENGWLDLMHQVLLKFENKTYCYYDVDGVVRTSNSMFIADFDNVIKQNYASLLDYSISTLEVVCNLPTLPDISSGSTVYIVTGGGAIPNLVKDERNCWSFSPSAAKASYTNGTKRQPMTISINANTCFENGSECEANGTDWFGTSSSYFALGVRSGNHSGRILGKWMSIRFYGRTLTTKEILQNQRVDNIRFNLGLSI